MELKGNKNFELGGATLSDSDVVELNKMYCSGGKKA